MIPAELYKDMLRIARMQAESETFANKETEEFKLGRLDFHLKNMVAGAQPPVINPGRAPLTQEEIERSENE